MTTDQACRPRRRPQRLRAKPKPPLSDRLIDDEHVVRSILVNDDENDAGQRWKFLWIDVSRDGRRSPISVGAAQQLGIGRRRSWLMLGR
jgi:hypothetical protein